MGLRCAGCYDERPTCQIIMLTAYGEGIDRVVGLELGADDYVVKPRTHPSYRNWQDFGFSDLLWSSSGLELDQLSYSAKLVDDQLR